MASVGKARRTAQTAITSGGRSGQNADSVAVFLDERNIHYSSKAWGDTVDFDELLQQVVGERTLSKAVAYITVKSRSQSESFTHKMEEFGYETKVQEYVEHSDGTRTGDWDIPLAIDAMEAALAGNCGTIVLCSGDGDFIPLVKRLQSLGITTEVLAYPNSCSSDLIELCDSFYNIRDYKDVLYR